jgi:lactate dehydrogenase-like 2-hydroxyacid dehydrogenase
MNANIAVLDRIDPTDIHIKRLQTLVGSSGMLKLFHDQPNPGDNLGLVLNRIEGCNIVITSWTDFPAELIKKLSAVKMISVVATAYSWIDVAQATKQNIIVTNVPGYAGNAVAELTFGLILSLARQLNAYHQRVTVGDFSRLSKPGNELSGKTIGIIGTGAIGSNVARIAHGFNMRVLANTKHPQRKRAESLDVEYVDMDTLLMESDIVSPHVNLANETRGMFDNKAFEKMKDGAIFVCTSRPEIYDEKALYMSLKSGKLGGAALDETHKESQIASNPLLSMPNVTITPEIGFYTEQALNRLVDISIDNVAAFINGKPINVVNQSK